MKTLFIALVVVALIFTAFAIFQQFRGPDYPAQGQTARDWSHRGQEFYNPPDANTHPIGETFNTCGDGTENIHMNPSQPMTNNCGQPLYLGDLLKWVGTGIFLLVCLWMVAGAKRERNRG